MRYLAVLLFSIMCAGPASARANRHVQFAMHSAFLMNLHHFLYDSASLGSRPARDEWRQARAQDRQTLELAAAYYKTHYANSDLLFDADLNAIKAALGVADERRSASGLPLPAALIGVLNDAAPAYARSIWPLHDQSNRRWIRQVGALNAVFGAQIEAGIERTLAHRFPAEQLRVDVVYHSGYWAGALTTDAPNRIVMPSALASYQGLAGLEMLYHEAAHIQVDSELTDAIDARLKAAGRPADKSGLWHAVHFYSVGEVVKDVLKTGAGINYQTYGDQNGVFRRFGYGPLFDEVWLPYMQGKGNFQQSVDALVARLPID